MELVSHLRGNDSIALGPGEKRLPQDYARTSGSSDHCEHRVTAIQSKGHEAVNRLFFFTERNEIAAVFFDEQGEVHRRASGLELT